MFRDKDFPWPPMVLHNFQEQERNKIEEWSISIQEEWPKKKKENKNNEPWQEQKKKEQWSVTRTKSIQEEWTKKTHILILIFKKNIKEKIIHRYIFS